MAGMTNVYIVKFCQETGHKASSLSYLEGNQERENLTFFDYYISYLACEVSYMHLNTI